MNDLPESADGGGAAVGERPLSSPMMSPANQSPSEIGPERWETAEKTADMIICKVQPTAISEERRRDVIQYVQRLIKNRLGAETIPAQECSSKCGGLKGCMLTTGKDARQLGYVE